MSIIDRYVLRQVIPPLLLALLVFTFVLLIPGLIQNAEQFIAKGVSPGIVARAMLMLVPYTSFGWTVSQRPAPFRTSTLA